MLTAVLNRIRATVKSGNLKLTQHAFEEAAEDFFGVSDVEHVLMYGKIVKKYTHDPRGSRFEVHGPAEDGRMMFVVCRFTSPTSLRVMTVFGDNNDEKNRC